jgi:hypothetical protein
MNMLEAMQFGRYSRKFLDAPVQVERGRLDCPASNWRHDQMVNVGCNEAAAPHDGQNLVKYIGTAMLRLILTAMS